VIGDRGNPQVCLRVSAVRHPPLRENSHIPALLRWHGLCLCSAHVTIEHLGVQAVSLEGELVEIVEEGGRRLAKIVLTAPVVLDVTHAGLGDAHLGDRLVVSGQMAIVRATAQTGLGQ
jgi:hypothetical protein